MSVAKFDSEKESLSPVLFVVAMSTNIADREDVNRECPANAHRHFRSAVESNRCCN